MFEELRDLWEGCIKFKDAVEMAGIDSLEDRRTARKLCRVQLASDIFNISCRVDLNLSHEDTETLRSIVRLIEGNYPMEYEADFLESLEYVTDLLRDGEITSDKFAEECRQLGLGDRDINEILEEEGIS